MAKQIKAKLTADTTDFERKMLRAKKVTGEVGKTLSIGLAAGAAAAAAGIYALNRVMSEAVSLANVQEAAEAKLTAVLKATGEAAGYNAEQLKQMAAEFQKVTTFGDEVTISGMAILATFKQIRGEGFERATKAAMDMSSVMGTDLNSSILQIGKALNNPIKGLSMLTRVGVTFTDQQQDQIKGLQKAGDMYGAQTIILKELETQFGGTSEALRNTFAGSVTAAENALGDLKEELGFVITKNQFFVEAAKLAEQSFVGWTTALAGNQAQMHALSKEIAVNFVGSIGNALEVMRFFHNAWVGVELVGHSALTALSNGLKIMTDVRLPLFIKPLDLAFDALVKIGALDINPFDSMKEGLATFTESSARTTEQVLQEITATNAQYDSVINKIGSFQTSLEKIPVAHSAAAKAGQESGKQQEDVVKDLIAVEDAAFKTRQAQTDAHIIALNLKLQGDQGYVDSFVKLEQIKREEVEKTVSANEKFTAEFVEFSNAATADIVSAFVAGEDTKVAVAGIAQSYLTQYAIDAATKGLVPIFEAIGAQIGAWVGLGTAQTSTEGTTWQQKLGSAAAYLAGAGAAVFAGKAIGDNFNADGGWLGANPGGGMLRGGSGSRDDLFLGYTDGGATRNWGMGGEYVVNKESTARFLPLLESINSKNFAEGGPVADAWGPTRGINDSGFDTFWQSVLESKGNWGKAIGESIAYYVGTGAAMIGGKAVGQNLFAEGGQVRDRGFLFGGFMDFLLDPLGEITGGQITTSDPFTGIFGETIGGYLNPKADFKEIWQQMRELPVVGETVERADKVLYPFVRDTLTPGKYPNFTSAGDMLKGAYEGLGSELATWLAYAGLDPLGGFFGGGYSLFKKDGGLLGSYESGTDYVPRTGNYKLHKGEAVVPAGKNAATVVNVYIGKEKLNALIDKITTTRQDQGVTGRAYI